MRLAAVLLAGLALVGTWLAMAESAAGRSSAGNPAHRGSATVSTDLPAPADTVARVWASTVTASSGGRATVAVRVDLSAAGEAPGAVRGRIRFEPNLLAYQTFEAGNAAGQLTVERDSVAEDALRFALEGGPAGAPARATLFGLTFGVSAPSGTVASMVVELEVLRAAGSGEDLRARTAVHDGVVIVR